ncbi:tape-measure protein [Streptomyces sp. NPDC018833]|uniref:tape-measure protein n=1 Tax=Streptomyces sp. NPDC018833 TaxID=3365053 RepID=UPI0037B731E8
MSTAALAPVYSGSLLTGLPAAFRNLSSTIRPANAALRELTRALREATGKATPFAGDARGAATTVSRFRTGATSVGGSVTKLSRSSAHRGVKSFGDRAGKAKASVGKLGQGLGGIVAILLPLLPVTDIITKLMETFGTLTTVAAVAMTAVNVAMRANPIGFLIGILVPVAAWLIEYAMHSETGQRIMKQVFAQALKGFQAVWKFIGPVMKLIGKAVGTYFKAYLTVITGVLKGLGSAFGGISRTGSAVSSAANALRGIVSRAWSGLRNAVQPVIKWITGSVPGFFTRIKDAVTGTLRGIGGMLEGGMQTVLGVVKGPINGLIAFANWIIDGLNKLSFSLLGKKFGVDIDKIPMLAEGGVVFPGSADAPRIHSLTELEHRRVPAITEPTQRPYQIREFREEPGAGPRSTAEDLLFLATARP